jgi:uncharacterized membrane protein YeaQ/YmgE (transglycosylase-associated protein family)
MEIPHYLNSVRRIIALTLTVCTTSLASLALAQASSPPLAEKVGATATEVTQNIQDSGQIAASAAEDVWKRIDEKRLKNRTLDELVAWALMGLLVGGLLYRLSNLGQFKTIIVGLLGAFIGGIVANVLQLNLGLGPVLIRYEELICSLLGGLALFFALKWYRSRKPAAAHPK